jgi:hypothetical protein
MLKTTRLALMLGLGVGLAGQAFAQGEPPPEAPAQEPSATRQSDPNEYKRYPGIKSQAELEERRAKLDKKRVELQERRAARLELQLKRMRDRAAQLRNEASSKTNELDREELERRAQRIETKATEMEARRQRGAALAKERQKMGDTSGPRLGREQRTKMRKAQLRRRWGQLLLRPDVIGELRTHAQRTARLKRIRDLARETNHDDIAQRSNALLAKEQQRHLKKMQAFERPEAAETGSAAAPNQPAAVVPTAGQATAPTPGDTPAETPAGAPAPQAPANTAGGAQPAAPTEPKGTEGTP